MSTGYLDSALLIIMTLSSVLSSLCLVIVVLKKSKL
jgi:hypothetical protein